MLGHQNMISNIDSVTNNPSLVITSTAFKGKPQLARHRMVNTLMKDEIAQEGGIHALQLTTRTPEEDEARKQKEVAA
jgi:stress-induced morphogen